MRNIYPTAAIWAAFERAVEEKVIADILDERTSVVVARWVEENEEMQIQGKSGDIRGNGHEGEIAGFAVWCHPSPKEAEETGTYTAPRWNLPPGTDWGILNPWKNAAARVADSVIGGNLHYGECTCPLFLMLTLIWSACHAINLTICNVGPQRTLLDRRITDLCSSRRGQNATSLGP